MDDDDVEDEDYQNNILATGAVYQALSMAGAHAKLDEEIVMDGLVVTNQIRIRFPFLKSPYIITVERDASSDIEL